MKTKRHPPLLAALSPRFPLLNGPFRSKFISRRSSCLTCLLFLFVTLTPTAEAQPLRSWFGLGLGGSAIGTGIGPSARLSLHVLRGEIAISGRASLNSGPPTKEYYLHSTGNHNVDAGLLIGIAPKTGGRVQFVAGAGPALVVVHRTLGETGCGPYGCSAKVSDVNTFGVAMEVGAYGRFGRLFGYSLVWHGNFNGEQPFAGMTLGLTTGKLR